MSHVPGSVRVDPEWEGDLNALGMPAMPATTGTGLTSVVYSMAVMLSHDM